MSQSTQYVSKQILQPSHQMDDRRYASLVLLYLRHILKTKKSPYNYRLRGRKLLFTYTNRRFGRTIYLILPGRSDKFSQSTNMKINEERPFKTTVSIRQTIQQHVSHVTRRESPL
jgi:hypothetical protein